LETLISAAVHPIFHACGISKVSRFKTNFSDEPVSLLPQKKLLIISQRFFGIPSGSTPENATRQSSTGAHPWLGGLRNSGETPESYTP
jgi:hypothetical protein